MAGGQRLHVKEGGEHCGRMVGSQWREEEEERGHWREEMEGGDEGRRVGGHWREEEEEERVEERSKSSGSLGRNEEELELLIADRIFLLMEKEYRSYLDILFDGRGWLVGASIDLIFQLTMTFR